MSKSVDKNTFVRDLVKAWFFLVTEGAVTRMTAPPHKVTHYHSVIHIRVIILNLNINIMIINDIAIILMIKMIIMMIKTMIMTIIMIMIKIIMTLVIRADAVVWGETMLALPQG